MSPILFNALNQRQQYIVHNTFKSDVFSLGICIFLAATLTYNCIYDIREMRNMTNVSNIIVKYLISRYSYSFIEILTKMLEIDEDNRPDFIELEKFVNEKYNESI